MILIIDDDRAICTSLRLLLKGQQLVTEAVHTPQEALQWLSIHGSPELIILDMNFSIDTSGKQGLKLLQVIRDQYGAVPVILITGWGTLQLAVQGMKAGAQDFITKPWDNKHMLQSIKTLLELQSSGNSTIDKRGDFSHIIGQDPDFLNVLETVKKVSHTDASILIMGESGTGKELIAEAIHYSSPRKEDPFVKVNLGGISHTLFESEMFGHVKGAYTDAVSDRVGRFEMADQGTIFLDEIGDLDFSSQVKLLRVLQEKQYEVLGSSKTVKVDVRVVSATNKDLAMMVGEGSFREDLYYRINLITVLIPPLRDRPDDIPLLVRHYATQFCELNALDEVYIEPEAMEWLLRQPFPGNVRQLKNIVERTILIKGHPTLTLKDFQQNYVRNISTHTKFELPEVGRVTLEEMEVHMIKKALHYHQHHISKTARSLGLTRSALYRRIEKYKIPYEPKF